MRALITGGAGFIGSHLADALLGRGDEVWVLDDLAGGRIENIADNLADSHFEFIKDSIVNRQLVRVLVASCDEVYHLAAVLDPAILIKDPLHAANVNIQGTENVLAAAAEHRRKVVLASSCAVYGKSTKTPLREHHDRVLGPTNTARWAYASAKAINEHAGFAHGAKGAPVAIVRLFNCYGPRLHSHGYGTVIARFIQQALHEEPLTVRGDGRQARCFTYVEDAVAGLLLVGRNSEADGRVFNIGDTAEVSILNLAKRIRALCRSSSEVRLSPYEDSYGQSYEDIWRRVPDISRARLILGFQPRMSLEGGLLRTIDWFRKQRAGRSESLDRDPVFAEAHKTAAEARMS
jgi:UDP-glucose 4-epimerase